MLFAKDYRRYARESLKGRWMKAGGVAVVAGLVGANGGNFANSFTNTYNGTSQNGAENLGHAMNIPASVIAAVLGVGLIAMLVGIVLFVISGATTLGYAKYNLNLVDDKNPKLSDIFSQFDRLGQGLLMNVLITLYITLWTFLFVIPGIIAALSYSMAPFILSEHPEMTANEAIRESKRLMRGHKGKYFCLGFSFFGWYLLAAVILEAAVILPLAPVIVGEKTVATGVVVMAVIFAILWSLGVNFFLTPYIKASDAVFYRELTEGRYSSPEIEIEMETEL